MELDGNINKKIQVIPSPTEVNSYNITAKAKAQSRIIYIKIKAKDQAESLGDRIVVVLEQSKLKYSGVLVDYFKSGGKVKFGKYIDENLGSIQIPASSTADLRGIKEWIKLVLIRNS